MQLILLVYHLNLSTGDERLKVVKRGTHKTKKKVLQKLEYEKSRALEIYHLMCVNKSLTETPIIEEHEDDDGALLYITVTSTEEISHYKWILLTKEEE